MQSIRKIRDSQRREIMHWRWHPEEFVAFVDSDDYIGKDFLKRMYNTAIEKKSDMVMCNYTKVTERGEIIQKYEINYQEKGIRIPSYLCCNRLVRRQLFDTWKIYFREGVICEDIPLILKLEAVATNIQTIGDGEYYYRANPQSTTSTIKNRKLEMWQLPFGELRDAIAFCTDKEHPMDPLKLEFFICRIMTSLLFDTGRGCPQRGEGRNVPGSTGNHGNLFPAML